MERSKGSLLTKLTLLTSKTGIRVVLGCILIDTRIKHIEDEWH